MGITLLGLLIVMFAIAVVVLFTTQVGLPLKNGTTLFPAFKKKSSLYKVVNEAATELEIETELVRLKEQLDNINRRKAELEK